MCTCDYCGLHEPTHFTSCPVALDKHQAYVEWHLGWSDYKSNVQPEFHAKSIGSLMSTPYGLGRWMAIIDSSMTHGW